MADKLLMTALSPTMETGLITKWEKSEGDSIEAGDILCQVETDKTVMDYESPVDGVLLRIISKEGDQARVGDVIAIVGEEGEDIEDLLKEASQKADEPDAAEAAPSQEHTQTKGDLSISLGSGQQDEDKGTESRIKVSPLARKIAEQKGLDLERIQGSGPGGRIVKKDVERALAQGIGISQPGTGAAALQPGALAEDEVVPHSGKRRIIAQRLAESKYSAPHYYLKVKVDMTGILNARKALNSTLKEKVSMNAFIVKFAAEALKRHPMINASWRDDAIIKHRSIDIGLAVAQPDGLITPVVRDCGNMGVIDIDRSLKVLIDKALNGRLLPEEYSGATFTISNLGSFGILEFTAIINPPGSAIMAVGEIVREAVVSKDDRILVRPQMSITLSCDHRVIDGAVGAAFMKDLKAMMEDPIRAMF